MHHGVLHRHDAPVVLLSYATKTVGMPNTVALTAQLVSISDRIGRKRTILTLYLTWLVWIWPMSAIVDPGSQPALIAVVAFGMLLTSAYGPIGAFLEQFDTRVRYTEASVGMTLGALLGGDGRA